MPETALSVGFPPIARPDARILILGSLPGAASIAAQAYYAHPRNAFWPIMGAVFGAGPELSYAERVERLQAAGVAVWDVLRAAVRPGSLDAKIQPESQQINDFGQFFAVHRNIVCVAFNGQAAATAFRRHVRPRPFVPTCRSIALPSTSPAHAARSFEAKLQAWSVLREFAGCDDAGRV